MYFGFEPRATGWQVQTDPSSYGVLSYMFKSEVTTLEFF